MEKLSLVVMTYNEEHNIERCLNSAKGLCEELLVVDSFSEDKTVALARACGARVLEHPFEGYIQQRAYAIEQAKFNKVLILDADEALDQELQASIRQLKTNWTHACYQMNRMSNIEAQWIRHGGWYPDKKMRLFERDKYKVVGINPHDKLVPIDGVKIKHIKGDILHYTNSSIADRVNTINKFSTIAAQAFYDKGKRGTLLRLISKPVLRFFVEYFIRRGFLDGFYGFVVAKTSAQYVFLREAKLLSLQKTKDLKH